MRWEKLGLCALALWCGACGHSSGNQPSTATAGAGGGSSGDAAGGSKTGAGGSVAGASAGGSSTGGAGAGVGMCSGSTNQKGGTRLKSKFWVTAEGDRAWDGLWDTELNQACEFNPASDGKIRCIPNNWDDSMEVYGDSSCTQALYTRMQIGPCTSADYIMRYGNPGSCDAPSGYAFFELGAPATPTKIYQMNGAECIEAAPIAEPLYAKGAEVPPTTFMEGTNTVFEAVGRIHPRGLAAADGTRAVQGWQDTQVDQSCYFETSEDGKMHCLPSSGYATGYADAGCTMPVVTVSPDCQQKVATYAWQAPDYQCAKPYRVLKRGDAFVGTPYLGSAASCAPGTATADATTYLSTPAAPELFQSVVDTIDMTDPGRLKPRYYDTGNGAGCWFHNFWDSELMTPCSFGQATDMKQRCMPDTYLKMSVLFSDDQCTTRAAFAPVNDCTPAELPTYATNTVPDACARNSEVYKVGDSVLKADMPPLWTNITGSCLAATLKEEKFLRLTLVDPSQFMAGESQLE